LGAKECWQQTTQILGATRNLGATTPKALAPVAGREGGLEGREGEWRNREGGLKDILLQILFL